MKICLVGPGIMPIPPKGWGAVEILIWDYYLSLKKKGYDVTIINKMRKGPNDSMHTNTTYCRELIEEINKGNYDFVHLHYDVLFHISDYLNCKVGLTSHYPYINNKNKHTGDGYSNIFNYMINTRHLNLILSKTDKEFLEANGANNCYLLENGISTSLFKYHKYPINKNKTIYLGKIQPRKNQHKYCHLNNVDIIGPGGENLQSWKGLWSRDEVHNKLSSYGNILLISDGEADPLVIKEALVCGLGVVVNDSSAKNLENKPFITIIPENKLDDIIYIQNQLDNNRQISIKLRSEIKKYGEEKYGFDNLIDNYLDIIEKNLKKKKLNEGYFLMGFGKKYIDECEKMVQTLRVFDSNRPVALMTHREDEKYVNTKNIFNDIIYVDEEDIKDDNIHNSFCVKSRIHMPKYMPYDKVISLDSDIICIYNPQHAWDFFNMTEQPFGCCGYDYEKCWHWGKVDNIIKKIGKKIPSIHGGVLYFNKTSIDFYKFYEYTKDALNNYDNYNCLRSFRGGMTDEVIFSIAMAKLDIVPLNYEKYPIVSFNLPISIKLPAFIQSREGEDTKKHIITKYPTIFNHLFFHEKSMPKERQIKLEGWYNAFHRKVLNMVESVPLKKKTIVCTMCTGLKFTSIKDKWSNIINNNVNDCKIKFFTNINSNIWYNRLLLVCNLYSECDTIVHIDMDCILMNNIDKILQLKEYNAVFSSENYGNRAFPQEYSKQLGFGLCCGFFIINKNTNSQSFLDHWLIKTKECKDDQIGIMKYICENHYKISNIRLLINKKSYDCKVININNIKILVLGVNLIGRNNFIFKQTYGNHIIANNLLNKSLEYYINEHNNVSIINNSLCHCSNPSKASCGFCYNKNLLISKFVCVTALYDSGRKDRNFDFYIKNIKKLLQFKVPLIIFCNKSTYNKLKDINREYYTQFIVREFEELDFYKKHYHEIKENISREKYENNVKDYGRPETIYPEYNTIQYSKFDFLCEVKNIINSQHYIWIDAGVPRFFNNIPKNTWPDYQKLNDRIIVQTFRQTEIKEKFNSNFNDIINHINLENECKNSRYLIIGTTFVVPNKEVEWFKTSINEKYQKMLNYGFLNNEQVALEFVVKENIEKFDVKINNSNNWYNMMEYI